MAYTKVELSFAGTHKSNVQSSIHWGRIGQSYRGVSLLSCLRTRTAVADAALCCSFISYFRIPSSAYVETENSSSWLAVVGHPWDDSRWMSSLVAFWWLAFIIPQMGCFFNSILCRFVKTYISVHSPSSTVPRLYRLSNPFFIVHTFFIRPHKEFPEKEFSKSNGASSFVCTTTGISV